LKQEIKLILFIDLEYNGREQIAFDNLEFNVCQAIPCKGIVHAVFEANMTHFLDLERRKLWFL
jgi:hypothetical protein